MGDYEKYDVLIKILGGENKIHELYRWFGSEKISFAKLEHFIKNRKIKSFLNQKKSIAKIASETAVSKMTVYRLLKKSRTKNKK